MAASFFETLLADVEHIAEADLPSVSDVRGVVAALIKRVEQLAGIDTTLPPAPLPGADPPPDAPPPPATAPPPPATGPLPPLPGQPASDLTIVTQLEDFQKGLITEAQLGPNAAKALAATGGNIAAAIAARQALAAAAASPAPDSPPADPNALEIATLKARLAALGAS